MSGLRFRNGQETLCHACGFDFVATTCGRDVVYACDEDVLCDDCEAYRAGRRSRDAEVAELIRERDEARAHLARVAPFVCAAMHAIGGRAPGAGRRQPCLGARVDK